MILCPFDAQRIKSAIDRESPEWRQKGHDCLIDELIIVVEIDGISFAFANGDSTVFGAGHLSESKWWKLGGVGTAVKMGEDKLVGAEYESVLGFVHFLRSPEPFNSKGTNPLAESGKFFREYPDEYSAFYPILFHNNGSKRGYKWRARPRIV